MFFKIIAIIYAATLIASAPVAANFDSLVVLAASVETPKGTSSDNVLTPEEKMRRRFPQPALVGDLIGLRLLDDDDITIGRVRQVVRTPEGKIKLIISYGGWFGWGARPVAVPIEAVAILGRQIAALDMPQSEFATAPTWTGTGAQVLPNGEIIQIALGRR